MPYALIWRKAVASFRRRPRRELRRSSRPRPPFFLARYLDGHSNRRRGRIRPRFACGGGPCFRSKLDEAFAPRSRPPRRLWLFCLPPSRLQTLATTIAHLGLSETVCGEPVFCSSLLSLCPTRNNTILQAQQWPPRRSPCATSSPSRQSGDLRYRDRSQSNAPRWVSLRICERSTFVPPAGRRSIRSEFHAVRQSATPWSTPGTSRKRVRR